MGAIVSKFNHQRVITTRSQLIEEINDTLLNNNTTHQLIEEINDTLLNNNTTHQDQLISSFLEIAIGHTVETARQFLETTNWNIEEAINLFYLNNNEDSSMYYHDDHVAQSSSSLYSSGMLIHGQGCFEDAKSICSRNNKWLLLNLQCRTDFKCQKLDRDLWLNENIVKTVESSFMLWQVYDHTTEGKKVSSFYKIDSVPPVIMLIDPITGEKLSMWSGVIEAQSFVEDLMKFMDAGPHERIVSLGAKDTYSTSNNTYNVPAPSWGDEFEKEDNCSSSNYSYQPDASSWGEEEVGDEFEKEDNCSYSDQPEASSWGEEIEEVGEEDHTDQVQEFVEKEEEICLDFPDLTEEPKEDCDRNIVCSLCIRLPDGRRKHRKFLKNEPVQLLWSFCYSHMVESERKMFKLVQAIPGASKTLDYGVDATFDQSGLANSMISVTWE